MYYVFYDSIRKSAPMGSARYGTWVYTNTHVIVPSFLIKANKVVNKKLVYPVYSNTYFLCTKRVCILQVTYIVHHF